MKISSILVVSLLIPITGIFLSYMLAQEEDGTIIYQPIFAQLGMPSDSILLNNTNMTTQIAPTITENTTVTPAPEVNNTLIGRSTPTTSNATLQFDNKTGKAEPLGGIK